MRLGYHTAHTASTQDTHEVSTQDTRASQQAAHTFIKPPFKVRASKHSADQAGSEGSGENTTIIPHGGVPRFR